MLKNYMKMSFVIFALFFGVSTMLFAAERASVDEEEIQQHTLASLQREEDALEHPHLSKVELLRWAEKATKTVYNRSYTNYQQQLKRAETFFTRDGWKVFKHRLKSSDAINKMIEQRLVIVSRIDGSPIIIGEGIKTEQHFFRANVKRYFWQVQIPLLITYNRAEGTANPKNNQETQPVLPMKQSIFVTLTIVRVPNTEAVHGIAIRQLEEQQKN